MCLQDLFIGTHTTVARIGSGASVSIPKNPNRIGLIVTNLSSVSIARGSEAAWYQTTGTQIPTGFNTADTNEVPPTDNTGTLTVNLFASPADCTVLHISQWGSVVQDASTVTFSIVVGAVFEIVADAVLQKLLAGLESKEGWPLYGLKGLG